MNNELNIRRRNDKWGFVDENEQIIIPCLYDAAWGGSYLYNDTVIYRVEVTGKQLFVDANLNYYDKDMETKFNCKDCVCHNDKITTGLCCQFNIEITGKQDV